MTPRDKYRRVKVILDRYLKIINKIARGGNIDPALAKKLGIPQELQPLLERAHKRGQLEVKYENMNLNPEEVERLTREIRPTNNPIFKLTEESVEDGLNYQLDKFRQRVSSTTIDYLKKEFSVIDDVFKDDRPRDSWLASELRKITRDSKQDWDMVVKTELMNSKNEGIAQAIIDGSSPYSNKGLETKVFKRPSPNACKHCRDLYLEKDDKTPKVFSLSELMANGTNYGKKVGEWQPVVGVTHPHCQCMIEVLPDGATFDKDGRMIYERRINDRKAEI